MDGAIQRDTIEAGMFPQEEFQGTALAYDPAKHHRRSIRLEEYDYSWPGWYYVTLCTFERECTLGVCRGKIVELTRAGEITEECWKELEAPEDGIGLDAFVIMPNHIHGITLLNTPRRGLINQTPTIATDSYGWMLMKNPERTLGKVVRFFKARACKLIRDAGYPEFRWRRNSYEHVVRNERDLTRIRKYIEYNPLQWLLDSENPENIVRGS